MTALSLLVFVERRVGMWVFSASESERGGAKRRPGRQKKPE